MNVFIKEAEVGLTHCRRVLILPRLLQFFLKLGDSFLGVHEIPHGSKINGPIVC